MATLYSKEYAKAYNDVPFEPVIASKYSGKERQIYAEIDLSAELATTDEIIFAKLPGNCRLTDLRFVSPDWGTTGACNIGWKANADQVADADGIFAALDCNTAPVDAQMSGAIAGFQKDFSAPTDLALVPTAASTALTGEKLVFVVKYVMY